MTTCMAFSLHLQRPSGALTIIIELPLSMEEPSRRALSARLGSNGISLKICLVQYESEQWNSIKMVLVGS